MHGVHLKPGDVVDKYEICELIGGGAVGDVYRARHTFLGIDDATAVADWEAPYPDSEDMK